MVALKVLRGPVKCHLHSYFTAQRRFMPKPEKTESRDSSMWRPRRTWKLAEMCHPLTGEITRPDTEDNLFSHPRSHSGTVPQNMKIPPGTKWKVVSTFDVCIRKHKPLYFCSTSDFSSHSYSYSYSYVLAQLGCSQFNAKL